MAKVTSKKEAARLFGAHRPEGAVEFLLGAASHPDVHRDVRVAIGRSLRGFLDDDRVWTLLAAMVHGSDDEARSLLETAPDQLAPRHRPRYAELILELCGSRTQSVRAGALAALAPFARWSERAPQVARRSIDDLGTGPEWRVAVDALATMLRDGTGWTEVSDVVVALVGRTDAAEQDAGSDRDRPSYQRAQAVLRSVVGLPRIERGEHRDELLALAARLRLGSGSALDELTVRLAAVDWSEPTADLVIIAARLDDHPLLIALARQALSAALARDQPAWTLETFDETADHLIGLGSVGGGTLAIELTQAVGARFGWPERWRARLRALRSHPIGDVTVLAARVWTATE
jgi:hypothetical protein